MRSPRFPIAWVMVFVALTALELGAIRAVADYRGATRDSLIVGALPMVNFLAVGLLIGHRRRGSRRFLLGFELFGATALTLYIALAVLFTDELGRSYLEMARELMRTTIGRTGWTTARLSIAYFILSLWACLPQMAFALIGGFLSRNFRIR